MSDFHTDSLRPSSLPTASLGRRTQNTTNAKEDTDAELDKVAEDWNLRIDKEMKALTGGLGELVELADVRLLSSSCLSLPNHISLRGMWDQETSRVSAATSLNKA